MIQQDQVGPKEYDPTNWNMKETKRVEQRIHYLYICQVVSEQLQGGNGTLLWGLSSFGTGA